MFNLKNMSLEELQALKAEIQKEIESRQEKPELVVYAHECKGSAKHHLNKYKHWAKVLTGIDDTKTNGYAFKGEFLYADAEHKLPAGSIVVEVCDDTLTAFEIAVEGKREIGKAKTKSLSSIIDELAKRF